MEKIFDNGNKINESFENVEKIDISKESQILIDSITDQHFIDIRSSTGEEPFPGFKKMLEEFKKHKILSKFFSTYKFLDENTKKDIKKFRILDTNTIFKASNLVVTKQIESTDFETKEILKLFNSSNMSAGFLYEDFQKDSYKQENFTLMMMTFIILQLKNPKINLTDYVNNGRYFSRKMDFYKMNGFRTNFKSVNGFNKNCSDDQNHRLFIVYLYNYVIDKFNLENVLDKIEYIDKKHINLYELNYKGDQIDLLLEKNIIISKDDLDKIFDAFDSYEYMKIIRDIKDFSDEQGDILIINKEKIFNYLFNNISYKMSSIVISLIGGKTKNDEILEEFQKYNISN